MSTTAHLVLEDGQAYRGDSFGAAGEKIGEVVFNTSMTGYQEILTDPSYRGQIVTMTATQIGNTGINPEDLESARPWVEGFVVKEASRITSNFRANGALGDYLKAAGIPAIAGIDTRALVRRLRITGSLMGILSTVDLDPLSLLAKVKAAPKMEGSDFVKDVTCNQPYAWEQGIWKLSWENPPNPPLKKGERGGFKVVPRRGLRRVVAYDYGIKQNILRSLVSSGCDVTVVPAATPAREVLDYRPDGVFLSNGPGDPAVVSYAIQNVKQLLGKVPVFGICLGHQIMGLALGGRTYKLRFGHHGGNQPVMNLDTGHVEITAQNHGFAVDPQSLGSGVVMTHVNLNDKTCEGLRHKELPAFSVQYHPEASPGPHDSHYLFQNFLTLMGSFHA